MSEELRERIGADVAPDTRPAVFTVMPCNALAFGIFLECQTQWRHSFSGVTGLDYTALIATIKLKIPKRKQRIQVMSDVRLIESGALKVIAQQRKESQDREKRDGQRVPVRVRNRRRR